jgi:hypothetical protein
MIEANSGCGRRVGVLMNQREIRDYVIHGRKKIRGWFNRTDAEIYSTIMLKQSSRGINGDAMEIGVHHGRAFILMNLCLGDKEKSIALDIFGNQEHNVVDPSGYGDIQIFERNLKRYGNYAKANIICKSSLELSSRDLRSLSSGLRFIGIDGAHFYEAVLNDIRLAASCAAQECVISIDDFFNPDYAEVAAAYYDWKRADTKFVPLCISSAKLYLCDKRSKELYTDALMRNDFLAFMCKKEVRYVGHEVPVFTGRHSGLVGLVGSYTKFYTPRLHDYFKSNFGKLSKYKNQGSLR